MKRVWAPTVEESKTGTLVFFEDHDRLMKEKDAQIERARKESEEMCNRVVSGFQLDRQKLNDDLSEMRAQIESLRTVLEAVRSQICWERDRDQLTMGMASLHDDVTKALEKKAMGK